MYLNLLQAELQEAPPCRFQQPIFESQIQRLTTRPLTNKLWWTCLDIYVLDKLKVASHIITYYITTYKVYLNKNYWQIKDLKTTVHRSFI